MSFSRQSVLSNPLIFLFGEIEWIMEYHQRRPGLKVLQERIDDFITAHEAREEQVFSSISYLPFSLLISDRAPGALARKWRIWGVSVAKCNGA